MYCFPPFGILDSPSEHLNAGNQGTMTLPRNNWTTAPAIMLCGSQSPQRWAPQGGTALQSRGRLLAPAPSVPYSPWIICYEAWLVLSMCRPKLGPFPPKILLLEFQYSDSNIYWNSIGNSEEIELLFSFRVFCSIGRKN